MRDWKHTDKCQARHSDIPRMWPASRMLHDCGRMSEKARLMPGYNSSLRPHWLHGESLDYHMLAHPEQCRSYHDEMLPLQLALLLAASNPRSSTMYDHWQRAVLIRTGSDQSCPVSPLRESPSTAHMQRTQKGPAVTAEPGQDCTNAALWLAKIPSSHMQPLQ